LTSNVHFHRGVDGGYVAIISLTKGFKCQLDAEDWQRISDQYGKKWHMCPGRTKAYARTDIPGASHHKGGRHLITMQRAVMEALPGDRIGFKNGDTMDCRKENLRFLRKGYQRKWEEARDKAREKVIREGGIMTLDELLETLGNRHLEAVTGSPLLA
jgi:hypothetical protein